ncbi:hypothetical protein ASD44_06065 [Mesorhizobium sp. Root554]|nr:hypothetical protein [Mesorhizobium sp. Root554]KQZ13687.1 hypothetical protein ASD27_06070 [Mesorhizobium sp. Root1471]KQZ36198.1 hypothetical protein ASD44_06065 [Mesorhizobium sp. Root554]MDR7032634.1 hypothetical protein [Mesorhizobium sp. BE184]
MKHHAASAFWDAYAILPRAVQRQADVNFRRLKSDPFHPSLHFKQVGRYWSVRIGRTYRAVAVRKDDDLVWFWIGTHAEYDKLIG